MILSRIIGLVLAPTGVIVAGWSIALALQGAPMGGGTGGAAVAAGLGVLIGLAMIIVGARYLLKRAPAKGSDSGASTNGGR